MGGKPFVSPIKNIPHAIPKDHNSPIITSLLVPPLRLMYPIPSDEITAKPNAPMIGVKFKR